jgi:hypothetical protein
MSTAMPVAISSYASQGIPTADYHSKLNSYVVVVSLVAASGGLLFGYDLGVTGQFCGSQLAGSTYRFPVRVLVPLQGLDFCGRFINVEHSENKHRYIPYKVFFHFPMHCL